MLPTWERINSSSNVSNLPELLVSQLGQWYLEIVVLKGKIAAGFLLRVYFITNTSKKSPQR